MSATVRWDADGSVRAEELWAALERVEDPELPLPVTDLGLVREIEVTGGRVRVGITYTSIACPCNDLIRDDVAAAVATVPGVVDVDVWDTFHPWSRDDVTPEGRQLLRAVAVV